MPPAVNQEINVNINALVKGIAVVRELAGLVRSFKERSSTKIQIDDKIATGAQQSSAEVDRLVDSIDSLKTSIEGIDERRFSRLAAAATVIGTIYSTITNVPAFVEGVNTLKDLSTKAPAIAGGLSSIATGARDLLQTTRQKVGDGLSKAKEVVSDLVSKLPGIPGPGAAAAGSLRSIGVAGAGAAIGVGALAVALGLVLTAVLALIGGVAVLSFLFSLAKGAADADSSLHDLSQELAVTTETLSALQFATTTTNTSFEEAANGVSKFNKLIGEARDGSDEARRNLIRLGVDPQQGFKDNEAALAAVFKRIHELPTPYEKARAAQIAFGKSGANMVAVIDSVGGSFEEAKKQAKEFGFLVKDEAARAADEFGDHIDLLKLRIQGFGLSIGRVLIPELLKLLRIFSHEMPGAGGLFQTVIEAIRLSVEKLVQEVIIAIAAIKTLAALPAALGTLIGTGNIESAFGVLVDRFKQELTELLRIANTELIGGSTGEDFDFGKPDKGDKKTPASTFEAELDFRRTKAEIEFNLEKDLLNRLKKVYDTALATRKIATEDYYRALEDFRRREIAAELKLNHELQEIARAKREAELKEIDDDPDTTKPQKVALKLNVENKFSAEIERVNEQFKKLARDAGDVTAEFEALQAVADKELAETFNQLNDEISTFNGNASRIEIGEILKRLNPILEDLRAKFGATSTEVQLLQAYIDALVSNAQFKELLGRFDRIESQRQNKIQVLTAGSPSNKLAEFQLREKINDVNREAIRLEEELINFIIAEAKARGGLTPEIQAEVEKRRAHVIELQRTLSDTELKDTAIDALVSGGRQFVQTLSQGVKSLGDLKNAALSFAQSFLSALSDIIIKMLVMKALSAIFGGIGFGGASGGGVGSAAAGAIGKFETGGDVPATSGGRQIIVAEGGFDEMVVTTDPRYAARTSNLLATFIERTGILPRFSAGSFALSVANSIASVPRLAAGAIVPAPSPAHLATATAGSSFSVRNVNLFDPADLLDALQTSGGERVVLNVISQNPQRFRAALGV
jgi:hypothetical protein